MKPTSLLDRFSNLEDPRQSWKTVYSMPGMVMAGVVDFIDTARRGNRKLYS